MLAASGGNPHGGLPDGQAGGQGIRRSREVFYGGGRIRRPLAARESLAHAARWRPRRIQLRDPMLVVTRVADLESTTLREEHRPGNRIVHVGKHDVTTGFVVGCAKYHSAVFVQKVVANDPDRHGITIQEPDVELPRGSARNIESLFPKQRLKRHRLLLQYRHSQGRQVK